MPSSDGRCSGFNSALAPGATVIAFSPLSDTQTKAVPVAVLASRTICSVTPASRSEASSGAA